MIDAVKDILANTFIGGLLLLIFGIVARAHNRRIEGIEATQKGCPLTFVTDKVSLERFSHFSDRIDEIKADTEKQWTQLAENNKQIAALCTKMDIILEFINLSDKGKHPKGD